MHCRKRQILLSALDRPDVGPMQSANRCEFFLRPALSRAELADAFSQFPLNLLHPVDSGSTLLFGLPLVDRPLIDSTIPTPQSAQQNSDASGPRSVNR